MDETSLAVALANITCKYLWSCFLSMIKLELVKYSVILIWLYVVLTAVLLCHSDVCFAV